MEKFVEVGMVVRADTDLISIEGVELGLIDELEEF